MEQHLQSEEPYTSSGYQWLRRHFNKVVPLFFTADTSPDNGPIVELQRRATWIALALILQSLGGLSYDPVLLKPLSPILYTFVRCLSLALLLGSFVGMWMAFRPSTLKKQTQHLQEHPRHWQQIILLLTFVLAIVGAVEGVLTVRFSFGPPQFSNDGTSLDTNAAALLLQGRNPYTDSSILDIARQFKIEPDWTTPLRLGQFANLVEYPSLTEFETAMNADLKTGQAPEFESKVSYPALSFLTLVPFVLFHDYNVFPFYLLSYLLLICIAWKYTRPELRLWVLLLGIANVPMWSETYGGSLDTFYILLVVVAWLLRDQRWKSALFLGLAAASKQIAWFFIPFYLLMIWRQHGPLEAIRRLAIVGGVALAFNLPFILWNPQAWLAGVLAPIADPMFPLGAGLISLSLTHLLPFFPTWVYGLLEAGTMLFMFAWYWRLCRKHPEAVMLLAVLPLIFAWRSLPSYFFCAAYPIFVLLIAKVLPRRFQALPRSLSGSLVPSKQPAQQIPVRTGLRVAMHIAHFLQKPSQKAPSF